MYLLAILAIIKRDLYVRPVWEFVIENGDTNLFKNFGVFHNQGLMLLRCLEEFIAVQFTAKVGHL